MGSDETLDVFTLGEALAVFLAEAGRPLDPATSFRRTVAGAELNLAIGLSRLGHRASWTGRVGDDSHGRLVLRTLRSENVEAEGVSVDPTSPTGLMVRDVLVDRAMQAIYYRSQSAGSKLRPDDLDLARLASSKIFAVSGVTAALSTSAREATMTAMQAAKEAGVCVVLDPNIRRTLAPLQSQVEVLRELCKYADIVLSGEDEALAISGLQEPGTAIAEWFLGQGCRMVAVKLGSRGAWATDGTQTVHQAAFPVRTVDTVGAGDAFAAGFISAILNGRDLPEALRRGAGCGAMNVSVVGDFDGSPTEGQLQTFLDGITDIER